MTAYYAEKYVCLQLNSQPSENVLALKQLTHSEMSATHIVHDDPREIVLVSS